MLLATPIERVGVVALQLRHRAVADAAFGGARQRRAGVDLVESGDGRAKADYAGQQVALILAVAQARLQLATVAKAVNVAQRDVLRRGVEVVAGQAVVVFRRKCGHDLAVVVDPRAVVAGAAFDIQGVQADRKLIARADPPGKRRRYAALVLLGPVVVGVVYQGVEAQCGVLAGLEVEVTGEAVFLAGAQGVRDFVLVDQQRRLVDLVDHAAGRALAKQHGGRALEHFDAVEVEGVALVQWRILHAIGVDVPRLAEREPAQAHVFLTRFAGLEGHARRGAQHFAEVILVAVVHQLFGEYGDRLRDVADVLISLAHGGFLHPHGVLALDLRRVFHGHRGQGGRVIGGLSPTAHGRCKHQCAQRNQGLFSGRGICVVQKRCGTLLRGFLCQSGLRWLEMQWTPQKVSPRWSARQWLAKAWLCGYRAQGC